MHRTQYRVDRKVANRDHHPPVDLKPEPYTKDQTMHLLTQGMLWWGLNMHASEFRYHEDRGRHPNYHTAAECNSYKHLKAAARKLRDTLNQLDLED